MSSKPTITVAIPSYNKSQYIERCIESVVIQKNDVDRIILVDNCSTDDTFEKAQKYEPIITCYRNTTNIGMAPNWNRCIALCETEWLLILHADDELLPDAIRLYREFISKYPTVGIIHANAYSDINDDISSRKISETKYKPLWIAGRDSMSSPNGVCSTVLVRTDAYHKLGDFIEESLSSDVEMWARIASKYDVGFINNPTAIYHANNSSTGLASLTERSFMEIVADWENLLSKRAFLFEDGTARAAFLAEARKLAPYNYWSIAKANLRTKNFKNAAIALWYIIVRYNGFIPLVVIFLQIAKKSAKHLLKRKE